jgi:phosphate:Na+ symporter
MLMKELVIPFATGLFIFIFGMQVMRIGFENLLLDKMKQVLHMLTSSPLTGLLTGALTTAVLQSSSAVMLVTIGLTHARILTLRQAIGIILGANIGTVVTVELLALNFNSYALYLFLAGVFLFLWPRPAVRSAGMVTGGFALLFIGMDTMASITTLIKAFGWMDLLYEFGSDGVISGILVGTIVTAIVQSGSATTVMAMNFLQDQILPLTVAIAIVLGSNIGTCMTAVLGSIGTKLEAKRVAIAHVLLNVGGVLFILPFISLLEQFVQWWTPNPLYQVAHAQLTFNVLCSFLMLPFVSLFERIVILCSPSRG